MTGGCRDAGDVVGGRARATVGFDRGRNRLVVDRDDRSAPQAGALAARVVGELLADHGVAVADLTAVVANPQLPVLRDAVAAGLGARPDQVVTAPAQARFHTAGLAFAYAGAEPRLTPGAIALLVSAGAGPTAGAALLAVP